MKLLNIHTELKGYDGQPLKEENTVLTLGNILFIYLSQAHLMGLNESTQGKLYKVGIKLGTTKDVVELEQDEYEAIKAMVDSGKITQGQQTVNMFNILVTEQVKELVNNAESKI